ncbi:MAG TPA: dienelactone hydrolase family protein [Stellaceae bacterium]|nr:dienelactone hydrolase family protein [Stellaceae bacterium]
MPEVTIAAADGGRFSAYLALPPSRAGRRPGIVMMQQIFGVNAEMRSFTDFYAAKGYVAICPDLFWRMEPGVQINHPVPKEQIAKALDLANRFDTAHAIADLKATVSFLRGHSACNGKVGTIGYCLGGRLAYQMATQADTEANIGYFGVAIEKYLDEAPRLSKPLLLHMPELDHQCPPEAQALIKATLAGKATLYAYPGADHAFNRIGARTYDAVVTELADERTDEFLRTHLGA